MKDYGNGYFISIDSDGNETRQSARRETDTQNPSLDDITVSCLPAQMADRVIYISPDGTKWVVKDRYDTRKTPWRL